MVMDTSFHEFLKNLEPLNMDVIDVVGAIDAAVNQPGSENPPERFVGPL